MATIETLKKHDGTTVYPQTTFAAVQKSDGTTLTNEIDGKLTEPNTGLAVGKYFRVASIDSDGHAVLEACDLPLATNYSAGIVKIQQSYGVDVNSQGQLMVKAALEDDINRRRTDVYRPLMPKQVPYIVKSAMTSEADDAWTSDEQELARQRIGINDYEFIDRVILTEESENMIITAEPDGTPYKFKSVMIFLFIPAGTRTGTNIPRARCMVDGVNVGYINAQTLSASNIEYCYWQVDVFNKMYKIKSFGGNYQDLIQPKNVRWPSSISNNYIDGINVHLYTTSEFKYPVDTKLEIYAIRA